jgi:hypothetical protein
MLVSSAFLDFEPSSSRVNNELTLVEKGSIVPVGNGL